MKKLRLFVAVSFMFTSLWSFGQKYGSTPEDSVQCVQNISLYREYFKQWKSSGYKSEIVEDCIKPWREALLTCPKSTKYLYVDGPKIVEYMYKKADDASKDKLFDTLKMVYDMRIEHFGEKGKVLGQKAVDMIQLQPQRVEEVYAAFVEAIGVSADKTSPVTLVYYMQSAINIANKGLAEEMVIFEAFDKESCGFNSERV